MSCWVCHLELEIDEWNLFYGRQSDDGEKKDSVNAPADNGWLFSAPHIETAVPDNQVQKNEEDKRNPGYGRHLQLTGDRAVVEEGGEQIPQIAEVCGAENAP